MIENRKSQSLGRSRKAIVKRRPSLFTYAVIDLASAPELASIVTGRLGFEARPLFAQDMPVEVLAVGPWLADLAQVRDLRTAIDCLDGNVPWGYFVHTSVDIVSLRHTLRRFNLVELPNPRRNVLFRYWDPRVMKLFLEIATREQRLLLFEFIERIEGLEGKLDAWYFGKEN